MLLYELYVEKCWSPYQIAKHFNEMKVDGWDRWTESTVKILLKSPTAIGVFVWNKARREYDWEREKWVRAINPRSQWEVYPDPSLAIVPMDQWKEARKKLSVNRRNSPLTGRNQSRSQRSATTLFCGYCGKELLLFLSANAYKIMYCSNGHVGAAGCGLSSSKSTRIIEKCLIDYLQDRLLTDEAVQKLVTKANEYLASEASKPRVDTGPLKTRIRGKEDAIRKLFERIEGREERSSLSLPSADWTRSVADRPSRLSIDATARSRSIAPAVCEACFGVSPRARSARR